MAENPSLPSTPVLDAEAVDDLTHVMCAECGATGNYPAAQAQLLFAQAKVGNPELLYALRFTGINVIFNNGCGNCKPDGHDFDIETTVPRHRMH